MMWSNGLGGSDGVHECCVLNEDMVFSRLWGHAIYKLCMLELIKVTNKDLKDVINMFKSRLSQYKNYEILEGENEESYISRIIKLEKSHDYKVNLCLTTTDKVDSKNRRVVVTLTEEDTDYLEQLKKVSYGMNISSDRKCMKTFNGMQSEYYNCHIEVVNSFKILSQALEYFLNGYSLKTDSYECFDEMEIDNRIYYSDCVFKTMENRLEYLLAKRDLC